MKKLFNALKGINKFGLALVLLTAISLMSFSNSKSKTNSTQYGRTIAGWVPVNDSEYYCNQSSSDICKASFLNDPNGENPQMDTNEEIVYDGLYVPIQR